MGLAAAAAVVVMAAAGSSSAATSLGTAHGTAASASAVAHGTAVVGAASRHGGGESGGLIVRLTGRGEREQRARALRVVAQQVTASMVCARALHAALLRVHVEQLGSVHIRRVLRLSRKEAMEHLRILRVPQPLPPPS